MDNEHGDLVQELLATVWIRTFVYITNVGFVKHVFVLSGESRPLRCEVRAGDAQGTKAWRREVAKIAGWVFVI